MKLSIGSLLVIVGILGICSAQVSQQRTYTVIIKKMELIIGNGEYMDLVKIRVTKYNRTTTVINGTFELLKDIPEDTIASVKGYQKYGTEYKLSMIQVHSVKLCDIMTGEKLVYPDLVKASNFPEKCPFQKGSKYIKNFLVKEENLPEELPGTHWRFDVTLTFQEEVYLHHRTYILIERDLF